jgi:hypothetical protein
MNRSKAAPLTSETGEIGVAVAAIAEISLAGGLIVDTGGGVAPREIRTIARATTSESNMVPSSLDRGKALSNCTKDKQGNKRII